MIKMEALPPKREHTLPTINELFEDNLEVAFKSEKLNTLLNQAPRKEWVKTHPFIKGYNYLPIDKVEFMLKKIFKRYRIEILNQGTAFNGVWVTVRVHYFNPATGEMDFHDGIGACQLQTASGKSAADLANINNGAISMAFPIAKTIAIKDACDHFGRVFGSDLNRKDTIPFTEDTIPISPDKVGERIMHLIEDAKTAKGLNDALAGVGLTPHQQDAYQNKLIQLSA